jgi:hypothetical protein
VNGSAQLFRAALVIANKDQSGAACGAPDLKQIER